MLLFTHFTAAPVVPALIPQIFNLTLASNLTSWTGYKGCEETLNTVLTSIALFIKLSSLGLESISSGLELGPEPPGPGAVARLPAASPEPVALLHRDRGVLTSAPGVGPGDHCAGGDHHYGRLASRALT